MQGHASASLGKEARRQPFGKARAAPLQDDQKRDPGHRKQQYPHHDMGDGAAAAYMAELGQTKPQAECQEGNLGHRLGRGIGGDGGTRIGRVHPAQHHQPRRRHHAAHRREGRDFGDGIAHQPARVEVEDGPAPFHRQQNGPGKGKRQEHQQRIEAENGQPPESGTGYCRHHRFKADRPHQIDDGDKAGQKRDGDADPGTAHQAGSGLARKLHRRMADSAVCASCGRKLGRSNSGSKVSMRRRFSE